MLDLTPEAREQLARAAIDWVLRYFNEQSSLPVYPTISASELTAWLASPLPSDPQAPATVLSEFDDIARYGRHNGHPRMFGYVQSSASFAGVIGDLLASAINQNVTSWRSAPAATTIEHQVIEWLKMLAGFDPKGEGVLLSGGSFANFAGLATALRAGTDVDLNQRGVGALPGRPRIYTSEMTHMSMPKAASMLGLGKDAIVRIRVDANLRMRADALREQIQSDRAGRLPSGVRGGDRGRCQHRRDRSARRHRRRVRSDARLWLHVDGSYGALAAQSPHLQGAMSALGRADSLSLDPHKWLYAPLDAGCLLVKERGRVEARLFGGRRLYRRRRRSRHVGVRATGITVPSCRDGSGP